MELLRVEHLVQKFNKGKFTAVDDISFSINKGEVLGLVGESGCGKTTTGRSIIGLYKITGGKIFFDDMLINGEGCKERKFTPEIQMIFQDPVGSLNPRMTVGEIVAEGLIIQGMKDKAEISKRVSQILEKVGIHPEYAGRYPHEFSGGQRQRIGIARAVIMNPKLIIADEPVSALDVSVKAQVINLLNDLRKEMGLTVLFIAHDLSVVRYFSDRIAVMNSGKIVELAPADELFENPLHPYTRALLSAVPVPDPRERKLKTREIYEKQDFCGAQMQEVLPGHFVLMQPGTSE